MRRKQAREKRQNLNTEEVGESSNYTAPSARVERSRHQAIESQNVRTNSTLGESQEFTASDGGKCCAAPPSEMEMGEVGVSSDARIPSDVGRSTGPGELAIPAVKRWIGLDKETK